MNHSIEYLVIGCYLVFMLAVGYGFRKFSSNVSDFFRAGGKAAWWMVGMSMFMSSISTFSFVSAAGLAFEGGWSVVCLYLANGIGYSICALFLGGWFRQLRVVTVPEAIRERFGVAYQQLFSVLQIFIFLIAAGMQLWALGIFIHAVFDLPVYFVAVGVGLVVLTYSVSGGSWAVMATDFIQSLMMLSITLLLAVLCLIQPGGVGGLFEAIEAAGLEEQYRPVKAADEFPAGKYGLMWLAGLFLMNLVSTLGLTNSVRFFSAKDGREAKRAAAIVAVLMFLGASLWFIPPMTARLLFESEVMAVDIAQPGEAAFAVASLHLLPPGLTGLMIIAMLAASMSSLDSGFNWNAGIFIRDLLPPIARLFGKEVDVEGGVALSRWVTVAFGLISIGIAVFLIRTGQGGVFEAAFLLNALLNAPLMMPLLLGLFIKRVPPIAGLVAAATGIGVNVAVYLIFGDAVTTPQRMILSFAVTTAAFLASTPFWRTTGPAARARVDAFFEKMHTPVDPSEVGPSTTAVQCRTMSRFTLAFALFIGSLALLPNGLPDRAIILGIAAFIGTVGGLLAWGGAGATAEPPAAEPAES